MVRPQLVNGNFYHIYNRGVLKQPIFLDEADYLRFVHDLWEFNDTNPTTDFRVASGIGIAGDPISEVSEIGSPYIGQHAPVIAILAWCLMPNHYHLLIQQLYDGGVSLFMKKLGIGFTAFMNQKYERTGHLFQGRFKVKPIDKEAYFLHISRYIHLNSVEIIEPAWKEEGIKDWQKAQEFLENYRWSSYRDWIGKKNFPSILDLKGVEGMFKNEEEYKKFIREWATGYYGKIKHAVVD